MKPLYIEDVSSVRSVTDSSIYIMYLSPLTHILKFVYIPQVLWLSILRGVTAFGKIWPPQRFHPCALSWMLEYKCREWGWSRQDIAMRCRGKCPRKWQSGRGQEPKLKKKDTKQWYRQAIDASHLKSEKEVRKVFVSKYGKKSGKTEGRSSNKKSMHPFRQMANSFG